MLMLTYENRPTIQADSEWANTTATQCINSGPEEVAGQRSDVEYLMASDTGSDHHRAEAQYIYSPQVEQEV